MQLLCPRLSVDFTPETSPKAPREAVAHPWRGCWCQDRWRRGELRGCGSRRWQRRSLTQLLESRGIGTIAGSTSVRMYNTRPAQESATTTCETQEGAGFPGISITIAVWARVLRLGQRAASTQLRVGLPVLASLSPADGMWVQSSPCFALDESLDMTCTSVDLLRSVTCRKAAV